MLYLYIVRHGETEWNKEDRIQGRLNSNLTSKGREYARLLGERLKETEFTQIIASPSQRTIETAQLIKGKKEIDMIQDERIMEMHMGPWQGLTKAEIKAQFPREYDDFMVKPHLYQNEGAESFADMNKRAHDFLHELKQSRISGNILVITHGLFIKSLYSILKGIEIENFTELRTVDGTSLTIVKIDQDEAKLMLEGDMGHVTGNGALLS